MSDALDWNAATIAEFRANEGRVGGNFAGAPMVLVHHRGRKSGREYVTPTHEPPAPHRAGRHLHLRNQGWSTHQPGLVPQLPQASPRWSWSAGRCRSGGDRTDARRSALLSPQPFTDREGGMPEA